MLPASYNELMPEKCCPRHLAHLSCSQIIFILPLSAPYRGFPGGSAGKGSACNAGDLASIPGLGRSPGEAKGYPLQYPGLENSMDCIVHGVAKLDITEQLSLNFTSPLAIGVPSSGSSYNSLRSILNAKIQRQHYTMGKHRI